MSLDIDEFKRYCRKKNEINSILLSFYERRLFRKLKLNGYLNRKRSEQRMINQFKKKFGNEKETIVCFGDFEQKKHMKFKEPIKGRGMRTLFRKSGFKVFLVDEFRTSAKCSKCEGGFCKRFMIRETPKPFRTGLRLVWGLLRCKTCGCFWNRDCNGAKNIYKIAFKIIQGFKRPGYLCRGNLSDLFHDKSNQNLH